MHKKLLIIDGNSILNRAFYGIKFLTNNDGVHTNGIYGFTNILLKFIDQYKPEYITVAFDLKAPTFRHKKYKEYKSNRTGMPEELVEQLPILKDLLKAMKINIMEYEGYEADDIIGTVAEYCENNSIKCLVVTGDRDSLQLASDTTEIFLTLTKGTNTEVNVFNKDEVIDKYGINPKQFIDVKGLMGDVSDNIPGVFGIGEKTALKLIKKYGSIENIYKDIDNVKISKKAYENLKKSKHIAFLSRELAEIDRNVPINIDIDELKYEEFDNQELLKLLKWLDFKSIISRLNIEKIDIENNNIKYNCILAKDQEDYKIIYKEIIHKQSFAYKFFKDENNNLSVLSIALDSEELFKTYYICLVDNDETKEFLRDIFENENIVKIGHNIKEDIVNLNNYGINYKGEYMDIMIEAYIVNPSRSTYGISELANEYLNTNLPLEEGLFGKGKKRKYLGCLPEEEAIDFSSKQTCSLLNLKDSLLNIIEGNEQTDLLYKIELPLVRVLADMQIEGFKIDKIRLKEFSQKLKEKIESIQDDIYEIAGEEFNINSPKQLGTILFEKLKLPVIKKTKTGYSTNAEVLSKLESEHKIIKLIMEYRHLVKLKTTYADGLLGVINKETGRIHSSFNQTVTVTGRISSTEPNMQNIPVRLDVGREIRKVFVAKNDDYLLIDADYSQIELRVLAHIANDQILIDAFVNNQDIHTRTASEVFGVPMEEVSREMRSRAKAVNFGIVYGIGDFSLGKDLGIPRKEAKKYIENYLDKYPMVKKYMKDIVKTAKEKGYVKTLLNRRRFIPELKANNYMVRSFGERVALNTPIQGSAADIIKIAMVNVYNELKNRKLKSMIILQVHDELIVEAHKDEIDEVIKIIKDQMTNAYELKVPLLVDINVGKSWFDTK